MVTFFASNISDLAFVWQLYGCFCCINMSDLDCVAQLDRYCFLHQNILFSNFMAIFSASKSPIELVLSNSWLLFCIRIFDAACVWQLYGYLLFSSKSLIELVFSNSWLLFFIKISDSVCVWQPWSYFCIIPGES